MYVYLKGAIDVENRSHNCVRKSKKALLVPVPTKGITANDERGNGIKQHNKQDSYRIQRFYLQWLRYN